MKKNVYKFLFLMTIGWGIISSFTLSQFIENSYNRDYQRGVRAGGWGNDRTNIMAIDTSGFIYIAGTQSTGADFGTFTPINPDNNTQAFIAKYTNTGQVLWVKNYGTGFDMWAMSIDSQDNILIAGGRSMLSQVMIGGFIATGSSTGFNGYVAKFSSTGQIQWIDVPARGGSGSWMYGIASDSEGNVIADGVFSQPVVIGSGTLTVGLDRNNFIIKYSTTGQRLWAMGAIVGGWFASNYNNKQVGIDSGGNIYWIVELPLGGNFITIPSNNSTGFVNSGNTDVFITKINSGGIVQWSNRIFSTGFDFIRGGILIDNSGNSYMNIVTLTPRVNIGGTIYQQSGFLISYSNTGVVRRVKRGLYFTTFVGVKLIGINSQGDFYVTMKNNNPIVLSGGILAPFQSGGGNMYIAKYDANGDFQWIHNNIIRYTGLSAVSPQVQGVIDKSGYIYVSLQFSGTVNFGPNALTSTGNPNNQDIFLAKFGVEDCYGLSSFGFKNEVVGGFDTTTMCWKKNGYNTLKDSSNSDVNVETISVDQVYTVSIPFKNLTSTGLAMPKINFLGNWDVIAAAKGTGTLDIKIKVFNPENIKNLLR